MTFNIISKKPIWFSISAILVAGSILSMALFGLRLGIDFTGGSLLEIQAVEQIDMDSLRDFMNASGYGNASLQSSDIHGLIIRTENLTEDQHQALLSTLSEHLGEVDELRFDSIGPVVGEQLRRTAITGTMLTLILIGFYVAWAFRKVSNPVSSWKYGVLTIVATFHDVIITVGVYSVLGHFFGWEIGTAFVAALLTILGYSINDTVVVFDRTRENLFNRVGETFEETVELSLKQTLTRSINTSLTTIVALLAIFLFGGESTRPFAIALIIGISIGMYSSIFLASPLLVVWQTRSKV